MKNNMTAATGQMELNLPRKPYARPLMRRQRRLPGANWWFTQMRQAVAQAPEWSAPMPAAQRQGDLLCFPAA